jgi:hypothetical protein
MVLLSLAGTVIVSSDKETSSALFWAEVCRKLIGCVSLLSWNFAFTFLDAKYAVLALFPKMCASLH